MAGLIYAAARYALLRPIGMSDRIAFGPFLAMGLLATMAARKSLSATHRRLHDVMALVTDYATEPGKEASGLVGAMASRRVAPRSPSSEDLS
jgi:hypothetical protein